jgi:hypothetical protein
MTEKNVFTEMNDISKRDEQVHLQYISSKMSRDMSGAGGV